MKNIYFIFLVLILVSCSGGAVETLTDAVIQTAIAQTQVAQPTYIEVLPTDTLEPTNTPEPTDTPEPTATNTPIPLAPSCEQIEQETDGMTDIQWDVYKKNFKGLWVDNWEGEVTEVSKEFLGSNFNVHVKIPYGCRILVEVKDEATALTFSKGDLIVVSGITSSLADIFGKVIYLDDETSSIFKK